MDKLTNLKELYLGNLFLILEYNQIREIANLENLTSLKKLDLGNFILIVVRNPLENNENNKKKIQEMRAKGIKVIGANI